MLITTANQVLIRASARLKEASVDVGTTRLSYFNQAMDQVLSYSKWAWAKKEHTFTLTLNQTEIDLETELTDYNSLWGVDDFTSDYTENIKIRLSKDNKKIFIDQDVAAGDELRLMYYQSHIDVTSKDAVLNVQPPKEMMRPLTLLIKHFVHDGKRQRNDARNAILDYQEAIEEVVLQSASKKSASKPQSIPHPLGGYVRTYANH